MKVSFSRKSESGLKVKVQTELLGPWCEKDQACKLSIQMEKWVKFAGLRCGGTNFHGSYMLRLNWCYASKKSLVIFTSSTLLCVGINGKQVLESACKKEKFANVALTTAPNHANTLNCCCSLSA